MEIIVSEKGIRHVYRRDDERRRYFPLLSINFINFLLFFVIISAEKGESSRKFSAFHEEEGCPYVDATRFRYEYFLEKRTNNDDNFRTKL